MHLYFLGSLFDAVLDLFYASGLRRSQGPRQDFYEYVSPPPALFIDLSLTLVFDLIPCPMLFVCDKAMASKTGASKMLRNEETGTARKT